MFFEEPTNVSCKRLILGLPGCIQRTHRFTVSLSYLLPVCFPLGDKCRERGLTICPLTPVSLRMNVGAAWIDGHLRI